MWVLRVDATDNPGAPVGGLGTCASCLLLLLSLPLVAAFNYLPVSEDSGEEEGDKER